MAWLRAFPDAQMLVETEIANGEWVAHRFLFEGTHEAPLAGPTGEIPATGRRLLGRGAQVMRVEDGEISEAYLYYDQLQVLQQLGLAPELIRQA
jgi:predicted ester cyclase